MFEPFKDTLEPWVWFGAGLLLMGLELAVPGSFLIWFGLAALVVGVLTGYLEPSWQWQLVYFGGVALIFLLVGRSFFKPNAKDAEDNGLNKRGERYIGRTFVLRDAIVHGHGTVVVADSPWRVVGPDLPAGAAVVVTGIDGVSLVVEQVQEEQTENS